MSSSGNEGSSARWAALARFRSPLTRITAIGVVLGAIYTLGLVNVVAPALRFTAPLANAVAFTALQLIPFVLLRLVFVPRQRWARVLCIVGISPVLAFAAFLGAVGSFHCASIVADGGRDTSFEQIRIVPVSTGHLAVYVTNGGATTSYGISVRQQCQLLPGLLRVRHTWSAYPSEDVRVDVLGPDRVRFSTAPYGDRRPQAIVEEVHLKPFWCGAGG